MNELFDAVVLGLGPSGTIVAHRCAERGLKVLGIDPQGKTSPPTVGLWQHQLPSWFPSDAIATHVQPVVVTANGQRRLASKYCVLATGWEQKLGGFHVLQRHISSAKQATIGQDYGAKYTFSSISEPASQARQLGFGIIIPTEAIPEKHQVPVLMDFSEIPGNTLELPTFSYRVPLDNIRWLIEETILATNQDPLGLIDELHRACLRRAEQLGIDTSHILDTEEVSFHLEPTIANNGPIPIGFAGGWMHPATGYLVGEICADTDDFLNRIANQLQATTRSWRINRQLRRVGLHTLLALSPAQFRIFFAAFFRLKEHKIQAYLTGNNPWITSWVMVELFIRLINHPCLLLAMARNLVINPPGLRH